MAKESFWERARYVLRVARKPSDAELVRNLKIIMAGILVLGGIGLVITLIFWFIYPYKG